MRQVRNELIKEQLLLGKPVVYRSSGGSLWPKVRSGDQCSLHPVTDTSNVNVGDIVFCKVQPGNRLYGHAVKKKECGYAPPARYRSHYEGGEGQGWYFIILKLKAWTRLGDCPKLKPGAKWPPVKAGSHK